MSTVLGIMHYTCYLATSSDYFYSSNYFIQELFQLSNTSFFVSHVLIDSSGVAMVTEIRSKCRALCVNMILL